jgi:hypothetical protein
MQGAAHKNGERIPQKVFQKNKKGGISPALSCFLIAAI